MSNWRLRKLVQRSHGCCANPALGGANRVAALHQSRNDEAMEKPGNGEEENRIHPRAQINREFCMK